MTHRTYIFTTVASAIACTTLLTAWYTSFFRGGYISFTTSSQTSTRIGIQEMGRIHVSISSMAPDSVTGIRFGLGYPHAKATGLVGFPGFNFDSYTGSWRYKHLDLPLWFFVLMTGVLPALWVVNRVTSTAER